MKEIKLSSVIDVISMGPFGSDIKVDNFISQGIPVLNGSNLTSHKLVENSFKYVSIEKANKLGKANAFRGDVVITHRGTLGQVSYIPYNSQHERYVISQSQFRVRFNADVDPVYFSYLMKSDYGQKKLLSFKSHVGVPALAQATSNFKNLELKLHDINTQKKIAVVLSALDDKIELNNQINAELEAMAKTLYDYWFVQFDFPNNDGKPYKSSGGKMVYNEVLKRKIPEGWEIIEIDALLKKNDAAKKINAKEYLQNGQLPVIDQSTEFIAGFTNDASFKISYKDEPAIIFGDHTRILKLINFDFARGADGTQVIYSNNSRMPQYLFYYSLKKIDLSSYGYARHFKFLKSANVILPLEEQSKLFNDKVEFFYKKILVNQKQNQELAQLRDWLLPMLMNGQVTVGEVEEKMGMVAEDRVNY